MLYKSNPKNRDFLAHSVLIFVILGYIVYIYIYIVYIYIYIYIVYTYIDYVITILKFGK